MPLILGTNSIKDTGYDVANSLRFNQGSDSLSKSISGTNTTKFSVSMWVKLADDIGDGNVLYSSENNSADYLFIHHNGNGQLDINMQGTQNRRITNRVFRDPSSWYNFLVVFDSTQASATNRIKLFVNGVQETSFATETNNMSQDSNLSPLDETLTYAVGTYQGQSTDWTTHGYISEFVAVYGTALSTTDVGEFDSDSPTIWKPKDVSGLTFGTNGFYLDFENSGSLGADVSGNSNNFTVNNLTSIDQSTDTCTNNFATGNALIPSTLTYSDGNLTIQRTTTNWESTGSTIAVTQGKWYAEFKWISGTFCMIGVEDMELVSSWDNEFMGQTANGRGYGWDGNIRNNGSSSSFGDSYSTGDIIGVALDMDNKFVYMSKNGTFQNSGDPTSGATGTGGLSLAGTEYIIGWSAYNSIISANFGSPPYTISSGNSDGNGYGNFEYAVPSGYYALNTKNLAEYG